MRLSKSLSIPNSLKDPSFRTFLKRMEALAGGKRVFVPAHWVQKKLPDASNRVSRGDNKE